MTKEDKELLLKDLCGRVHHLPIVYIEGDWYDDDRESYTSTLTLSKLEDFQSHDYTMKPYLRPLSSMTEEEFNELSDIPGVTLYPDGKQIPNGKEIDWLIAHYFDYRGLIPMGLALEAVNMY